MLVTLKFGSLMNKFRGFSPYRECILSSWLYVSIDGRFWANDDAIIARSRSSPFLSMFVSVLLFGSPVCNILKEVEVIRRGTLVFDVLINKNIESVFIL